MICWKTIIKQQLNKNKMLGYGNTTGAISGAGTACTLPEFMSLSVFTLVDHCWSFCPSSS